MAPLARLIRPSRVPLAVVAVTFAALLVSAGLRATPGVLMLPLELHFGWSRTTISSAAGLGIVLYGLVGPFAAALMLSLGIRRTMLAGLLLMSLATLASLAMTSAWQFVLTWGVLAGIGTGMVASVLGAAVMNRWFATRQGLVMGVLSASTATGALIFLPFLAWLTREGAWRPTVLTVSLACMALVPVVWLLVPERPADVGTRRFGATVDEDAPTVVRGAATFGLAFDALRRGMRQPMFWLLFGTFFVCGLTTNGLVGTHLIPFCGDHGIGPVAAAGLLSMMGLFDLVGTTASGWLTDRYDPKRLLFFYYGLRGLSLIALPFLDFTALSLGIFAIFYGLDWIATVPPTVKLANEAFGEAEAPIMFGWINAGHQLGAGFAAFAAGLVRETMGTYLPAFVFAGAVAVVASLVLLRMPGTTAQRAA